MRSAINSLKNDKGERHKTSQQCIGVVAMKSAMREVDFSQPQSANRIFFRCAFAMHL